MQVKTVQWGGILALTHNPTRTRTLEKNWFREINKRWSEFERLIISRFVAMNEEAINNAGTVGMNSEQLRIYMVYLDNLIEELLLGNPAPRNWQNQYQLESYIRGLERTRQSLISQGADLIPTAQEQLAAQGLQTFTARASLASSVPSLAPIHQEGLSFLFTRSYESLNGWTDALSKEVRQISFDAVREGKGVTETMRKIQERTQVSKSRAELIASTEINAAYRESSISETEKAGDELGEVFLMRWISADDTRVRHLHAGWHGTKATTKETRARGNKSPYRCRCSQIPVIEGASDTPAMEAKFAKERKTLLDREAEKKEADKKA